MKRIILGTTIGFYLGPLILNFIESTDIYYRLPDAVGSSLLLISFLTGGLTGAYIGKRFDTNYKHQVAQGLVRNPHIETAGKIFVLFILFSVFLLIQEVADYVDHTISVFLPYLKYIFWFTATLPIISSFFAIRGIIEIRKSKQIGMFTAISILILSSTVYIYYFLR